MKLTGKFEKEELHIGLSAELPCSDEASEGFVFTVQTAEVKYEKKTFELELEGTSDDLIRTPERERCYRLISLMPQAALPEVQEELTETYKHYLAIEHTTQHAKALPEHRPVTAKVIDQVAR